MSLMSGPNPATRNGISEAQHEAVAERLDQLNRLLDQAHRNEWVAFERTRIAQELHDRVAQTLFSIGLTADWLLTHIDRDEHIRPDLERLKQMASVGMHQVREAIFSLSSAPVEATQFKSAVRLLLNELAGAGTAADLKVWGDLHLLPPELTDALYQIVREALVNIRRHSGAASTLVSIRMEQDHVTAVIQDDGKGLAPGILETYRHGGTHLGLRGMEHRVERLGGRLTLLPGDDCGLCVTVSLPLKGVTKRAEPNSNSDR